MQGILEIRAVGNIQSDDRGVASASHLAIASDDRQHAHPRNVARQIAEDLIALRRVERHFRVDTRRNAQQGTRRIDHLALRGNTATSEIDDLAAATAARSTRALSSPRTRSTIKGAIANRATTISRARMLRIGLLRRFLGGVAFGKALGDLT
jgi:hypothetical protein